MASGSVAPTIAAAAVINAALLASQSRMESSQANIRSYMADSVAEHAAAARAQV
jgi:hypothetical protein